MLVNEQMTECFFALSLHDLPLPTHSDEERAGGVGVMKKKIKEGGVGVSHVMQASRRIPRNSNNR